MAETVYRLSKESGSMLNISTGEPKTVCASCSEGIYEDEGCHIWEDYIICPMCMEEYERG